MTGVCTTRSFLRRVSLSVTASILLAAAHSHASDTPTDAVPNLLEVSVGLTCPSSSPHWGMVSEVALRRTDHRLVFTATKKLPLVPGE